MAKSSPALGPASPHEIPARRIPPPILPSWRRLFCLPAVLMAARLIAPDANAGAVTWNVDSTNSYLRLTIPDQTLSVTNLGDVTLRMRDATSATQWTDAGGRRAALGGEVLTDYVDGSSITFLGAAHNLFALEGTTLRPNPASWDAAAANYTDPSAAPAALGGRVRGTYILTFDAAFLAFRGVRLDLTNATGEPIAITNGAFATHTTRCGLSTALVDVDGLELPFGLGQPIPDVLHADLTPLVALNAGGGVITNLGGPNRRLTYTIHLPDLAFDLSGTMVTGSVAGLIVADTVLSTPTPPPTLSAQRIGGEIMLAWPTNATGFSLEYTMTLPATNWLPVSPPPVIVHDRNVVTNTMTRAAAFYRLRQPQSDRLPPR